MTMFTTAYIESVSPPQWTGADMLLSWVADPPPGYVYQVYLNESLAWHGSTTYCHLPWPSGYITVAIGNVLAAEATTDFSADLAAVPQRRAELEWLGGTFLDPTLQGDIAGFHVYGEATPGGGIDYGTFLADIPAYVGQAQIDGWGYGGFGLGGFGLAAGSYSWTSNALTSGTWTFAVKSYSLAGNESTPQTCAVVINVPPLPPAPYSGTLVRLHYSLLAYGQPGYGAGGFGEPEVLLQWNASPSA